MGFVFTSVPGYPLTLRQATYQALHQAGLCWEHVDRAGQFDRERLTCIVDQLLGQIYQHVWFAAERPSEAPPVRNAVFNAVDQTCECWERLDSAGRFNYDRARGIAEALLEFIDRKAMPETAPSDSERIE